MAQLTLDQKREIALRLGYRLEERDGGEKRELYGPDGRHRAIFRPSKAMDVWIWNDAVFNFELYQDRLGAVYRLASGNGEPLLEQVWPTVGEVRSFSPSDVGRSFERLGGTQMA